MSAHMYSTVISTTETHNGNTAHIINSNYFHPASGVFVPQNIQEQVANNPIEIREIYNAYDEYGNLLEKQKLNGLKEVYLWGYDKQFVVASVTGSDYATVSGLINLSILNAPSSDAVLRQELDKIRIGLPNALVTTYTYDNVYGLTSITDVRGRTLKYYYDGLGRLAFIKDHDGNVIKKFCYNYAGQTENCISPCLDFSPNWQNTNTALRCQQGSCGNTGYQEQEQRDINPCSPTYNQTQWILAGYNPTACTVPTCVSLTSTNVTLSTNYQASYYNTTTGYTYNFNISTSSGLQNLGTIPAGTYNLTISRTSGGAMYGTFKSGCKFQSVTGTSATFYGITVSSTGCNSITINLSVD
jgi:YD repeat-containing protein